MSCPVLSIHIIIGHVITNDMTDDADMMRQRRQLYALGNVLSRRFHMCSIEVKKYFVSLVLYTNVYLPVYGVMVEFFCTQHA